MQSKHQVSSRFCVNLEEKVRVDNKPRIYFLLKERTSNKCPNYMVHDTFTK